MGGVSNREEVELSVLIPTLNEEGSIGLVVEGISRQARRHVSSLEVLVVDGGSTDATVAAAKKAGARVLVRPGATFGESLRIGFQACHGNHILAMDGDGSHPPEALDLFWPLRDADLVIASRFIPGGKATMPPGRYILSRILNGIFSKALSVPFQDISSGYRLYASEKVRGLSLRASDFAIQQEILFKLYAQGGKIVEVPFHYCPRAAGRSKARVVSLGHSYLRTLCELWKIRSGQK